LPRFRWCCWASRPSPGSGCAWDWSSWGLRSAMAWVGPRPVAPGRRGRPDRAGRCRGAVQRPQACGQTAPGAAVPGVAVGMNHPAPGGLAIAALMVAGCAWATLVTSCWPRPHPPTITPTPPDRAPDPADARLAAGSYAIGFAATAGIGLALGYLLDLVHVAWQRRRPSSSCGPIQACSPAGRSAGRLLPPPGSSPGASYFVAGQPRSPGRGLSVAWPGGLPCPWTPGTVDTVACRKAARGKRRSQRSRPCKRSPAEGRLGCRG
jgi:hypothetical protein